MPRDEANEAMELEPAAPTLITVALTVAAIYYTETSNDRPHSILLCIYVHIKAASRFSYRRFSLSQKPSKLEA